MKTKLHLPSGLAVPTTIMGSTQINLDLSTIKHATFSKPHFYNMAASRDLLQTKKTETEALQTTL